MRRPDRVYDIEPDPNADYKDQYVYDRLKEGFESVKNWIYLGRDARDTGFAKVGITMGDLRSRSSSPMRPSYSLFCAFKCRADIKLSDLRSVEKRALKYLEETFTYEDGRTKRELHHDSRKMSECFYDVDFRDFFVALHDYLLHNHAQYFETVGYTFIDGESLDCQFNEEKISRKDINSYIRMIAQ